MKYFFFIILLAIISSCGTFSSWNGQLRYVKVANQEIAIIEKSTSTDAVEIKESHFEKEIEREETSFLETTADVSNNEKLVISKKNNQLVNIDLKETNQLITDDEDEIVNQAFRTEKNASASMYFAIAGILTIIPYLGIFPLLIGFILYLRANSSRYITPLGEDRLRISKIFLIIDTIILILWIMFIISLILLF
jgi:hypothetical protein